MLCHVLSRSFETSRSCFVFWVFFFFIYMYPNLKNQWEKLSHLMTVSKQQWACLQNSETKSSWSRVVEVGWQWGHSPLKTYTVGAWPPQMVTIEPNHNASKQGLYCSRRKPYKAFQCDLSYFDQRQSCHKPEVHSTNKMKMKCYKFL